MEEKQHSEARLNISDMTLRARFLVAFVVAKKIDSEVKSLQLSGCLCDDALPLNSKIAARMNSLEALKIIAHEKNREENFLSRDVGKL